MEYHLCSSIHCRPIKLCRPALPGIASVCVTLTLGMLHKLACAYVHVYVYMCVRDCITTITNSQTLMYIIRLDPSANPNGSICSRIDKIATTKNVISMITCLNPHNPVLYWIFILLGGVLLIYFLF